KLSVFSPEEDLVAILFTDITNRINLENQLKKDNDYLEEIVQERTKELEISLNELEKTNFQLYEANKHKDRFLSTMSHELRTPLNAILGFSDLLKQNYFGKLTDIQLEYMDIINKSGKHLLSLINDILSVTKMDSGIETFQPFEFNVSTLVEDVYSLMKMQFAEKHIEFNYTIDDGINTMSADLRKCKQVLINLLSNALKFTPSEGIVTMSIEYFTKNEIKFTIKDTGIGIQDSELNKVFKEFYQVDRKRDEALGGTGIGLALVKRIVEMHKGTIGVTSKYGFGSTFWFILPINTESNDLLIELESQNAATA
ncbi:MAG: sensor histidine kinase, partial [Vampirovibrionia bacterium]